MQQIYVRAEVRTRLKALAYIDDRTLLAYLDKISKELVQEVTPKVYRAAIEAVSDGSPENA